MKRIFLIIVLCLIVCNYPTWGQIVFFKDSKVWDKYNIFMELDEYIKIGYSIKDTVSNGKCKKILKIKYFNKKEFPFLMQKPSKKVANSDFETKPEPFIEHCTPLKMWHYFYFDEKLEGVVRGSFLKDYFEEESTTEYILLKPLGAVSFSFLITDEQAKYIAENPNKLEAYVVVVPFMRNVLLPEEYLCKDEDFWCDSSQVFYSHSSKDVRKKERQWYKSVKKSHKWCGTGLFRETLEIQATLRPLEE